jgi:uncharacterized membrane protein YbhN (UPF0104 family)
VQQRAPVRVRRRRQRAIGVAVLIVLAATAVGVPALTTDMAGCVRAAVSLWGWLSAGVSALTWPTLLCLTTVSGLHYIASTGSARAAAGVPLPFGELLAVQFAAAAANRLTPAGLGGATVMGRYFTCRSRLRPSQAVAAVSALAVLGSAADVLAFGILSGLGTLLGLGGAGAELPLLLSRFAGLVPLSGAKWIWGAAGAGVAVLVIVCTSRLREGASGRWIADALRGYHCTLGLLARQPGRLAALMGASASTTMLLAVGFAATSTLGSHALPSSSFFALMLGYMVASAAGNAIPVPGGIGAAELALMGVLIAEQMPVADALSTVLAFRLVTFWTPAVIGALLVRPLRRRGAL